MLTKVTVISDTHGRHEALRLPPGDLLIHCGDMFNLGSGSSSLRQLDEWFGRQNFELILCTGGNHDHQLQAAQRKRAQPFKNAHLLQDELVEFRGLKIYGAPWVPNLPTHAYFKNAEELAERWSRIPARPDILVTHTPPRGLLDRSSKGLSHGCEALSLELARIEPSVHCFGHVHASAGCSRVGDTLFINASSVKSGSDAIRQPLTFSISPEAVADLKRPNSWLEWARRLASRSQG